MHDNGDTDDSIRQKIEAIIARMTLSMEALEIEGGELITLDDDRSLSLDSLATATAIAIATATLSVTP
jgi:hypothetical protein